MTVFSANSIASAEKPKPKTDSLPDSGSGKRSLFCGGDFLLRGITKLEFDTRMLARLCLNVNRTQCLEMWYNISNMSDVYDETFPMSDETTQYHLVIKSEDETEYEAFLWDETVRKIIDLIDNS